MNTIKYQLPKSMLEEEEKIIEQQAELDKIRKFLSVRKFIHFFENYFDENTKIKIVILYKANLDINHINSISGVVHGKNVVIKEDELNNMQLCPYLTQIHIKTAEFYNNNEITIKKTSNSLLGIDKFILKYLQNVELAIEYSKRHLEKSLSKKDEDTQRKYKI